MGTLTFKDKIQYMERADTATPPFLHVYRKSLATQINGISLVSYHHHHHHRNITAGKFPYF